MEKVFHHHSPKSKKSVEAEETGGQEKAEIESKESEKPQEVPSIEQVAKAAEERGAITAEVPIEIPIQLPVGEIKPGQEVELQLETPTIVGGGGEKLELGKAEEVKEEKKEVPTYAEVAATQPESKEEAKVPSQEETKEEERPHELLEGRPMGGPAEVRLSPSEVEQLGFGEGRQAMEVEPTRPGAMEVGGLQVEEAKVHIGEEQRGEELPKEEKRKEEVKTAEVRKEGETVPQAEVEMKEGEEVRGEGETVPQVKEEKVGEEGGPGFRKEGEMVPQLRAELEGKEEGRPELPPGPTEEERRRLERGALVIEQPAAAEGLGEVEKQPKPEEKEENLPEFPIHTEVPERPEIQELLHKVAEERLETKKEQIIGELKEEIKGEAKEGKMEEVARSPSEEAAIEELEKVLKEASIEERRKAEEKVCVITGINSGLGQPFGVACAKQVLTKHPDWVVYLTDRDESLGEAGIRKLNDENQLECRFYQVDPNSMVSLRNFREYLKEKHGDSCIHVLINNVDYFPNVKSTESGANDFKFDKGLFEETVKTNYFGSMSICLELFPLLRDDARVIFHASRFGQAAFMHTNETLQNKLRGCFKVDQVSEVMEMLVSTDLGAISSATGWISDSPMTQVYRSYTLGSIYPYGIANLGTNLLAFCYQKQFDEEKGSKNVHINACCPGLERGDKSPDEGVDSIMWLVEQPSESNIKGRFVADRKVIDHFVIPPGQDLF